VSEQNTATIGVGIIGMGWMGRVHTYAYRSVPFYYSPMPIRTKLIGVAVRRKEKINEAVNYGGFEFGTDNWRDLIKRDDIGIINVCTPNDLHAEQVIAAIEAGKHVYCDKPLARDAKETQFILGALKKQNRPLVAQVALQYRFYPSTMRARKLLDEGRLGTIRSIRACYLHASLVDANRPAGWRLMEGKAGGTWADMGPHLLDLVIHYAGLVQSILADSSTFTAKRKDASGKTIDVTADDMTVALLRMRNGASATVEVSKIAAGSNDELRIELHGDKGSLRLNLMDPNSLELFDQRDADAPLGGGRGWKKIQTIGNYPPPGGALLPGKLGIGWITAHVACLHNFLAAIATRSPACPSLQESLAVQRVIDAGYESHRQRAWIDIR